MLTKVLYFHGGPGMNSLPETRLLSDEFLKAGLEFRPWNEPSVLRPQGPRFNEAEPFRGYVEEAEKFLLSQLDGSPIVLVGHSFGSHAVRALVAKHAERLSGVVMIAPDLSLPHADVNMFSLTERDFRAQGDLVRSDKLRAIIAAYAGKFDQNTEDGMKVLIENPRLFNHYWFNAERRDTFLGHYAEPGFGLDLDAFFKVRRSLFEVSLKPVHLPCLAVFGKHDIVISRNPELEILRKSFTNLRVQDFSESAHYPHIEQTQLFMLILLDFARSSATPKQLSEAEGLQAARPPESANPELRS